MTQCELRSIGPLVIAVLQGILFQPLRSHVCGATVVVNSSDKEYVKYRPPRRTSPVYLCALSRMVVLRQSESRSDMIQPRRLARGRRATDDHYRVLEASSLLCIHWHPCVMLHLLLFPARSHGLRLRASTACLGVKRGEGSASGLACDRQASRKTQCEGWRYTLNDQGHPCVSHVDYKCAAYVDPRVEAAWVAIEQL